MVSFLSLSKPAVYLGPWRVMDSNHRRHSRQIYSLLPLATRATLRIVCSLLDSMGIDDELTRGLEPLTTCLQNRCSTIELRQPSRQRAQPLARRRFAPTGKRGRRLLPRGAFRKQDLAQAN